MTDARRAALRRVVKVVLLTLVACGVAGEVTTRLFIPPYVPHYEKLPDEEHALYRRRAGREGEYILRNVKDGYFRMNNEGWHSTHDYVAARRPGVARVALVGNSYLEGVQVDVRFAAYPTILEGELLHRGVRNEVYTFAMGAAHLAQALHLGRYVIDRYRPDVMLVHTIGGNFMRTTSPRDFLMTMEVVDGVAREVVPSAEAIRRECRGTNQAAARRIEHFLYRSRLIATLDRQYAAGLRAQHLLGRIGDWLEDSSSRPRPDAASDTELGSDTTAVDYEVARLYLLDRFAALERDSGVKVVFVIGPWHKRSFNFSTEESPDEQREDEQDRQRLRRLLEERHLCYLDLTDAFARDYERYRVKFDFLYDQHPNEHTHRLMGYAAAAYLLDGGLLAGGGHGGETARLPAEAR